MLNCLIIEDEQDAQELLKDYIKKTTSLHLVGVFESGLDVSLELLQKTDLLFLDIQLPELNGIQFLKSLEVRPSVIFTTAYANFAIDAFDLAATDYLLKPFSFERFYKAVNRVIENKNINHNKQNIFFVYADKTTHKIKSSNIIYLKAEVDYVKIKTTKQEILILDSLRNWVNKLEQLPFLQIHRSYIVNMEKVENISGNRIFLEGIGYLPIGITHKKIVVERFLNKDKRTTDNNV